MRKVLVAFLSLFFLWACSQKNEIEETEIPENGLELKVRSGESEMPVEMSASVYDLTGLEVGEPSIPVNFGPGEAISFRELISGEYTYFVLGSGAVGLSCPVSLLDKDKKLLELDWHYDIPELFGGIVTFDGSNATETVEMSRLVGGVEINVVNKEDFMEAVVEVSYMEPETIRVGDYTLVPARNIYWFPEGNLVFGFPTATPVKGRIIAYDEFKNECYFEFESTKCIERNKRLTLNVTLERSSSIARSGNAGNTVVCVEEVTEL